MRKIFALLFILLFLVPFVFSQDSLRENVGFWEKTGNFIKDRFDKVVSFGKGVWNDPKGFFFGGGEIGEEGRRIIGAGEFEWGSLIYLVIGGFAGVWIFLVNWIALGINKIQTAKLGMKKYTDPNPFRDMGDRWLNFIGGRGWKVLLIAIGYWLIMQIPLINRFVQIVTFDLVFDGVFWKSIILAAELGFLPGILEYFWKDRMEVKYRKKLDNAAKVGASARAASEADEES